MVASGVARFVDKPAGSAPQDIPPLPAQDFDFEFYFELDLNLNLS